MSNPSNVSRPETSGFFGSLISSYVNYCNSQNQIRSNEEGAALNRQHSEAMQKRAFAHNELLQGRMFDHQLSLAEIQYERAQKLAALDWQMRFWPLIMHPAQLLGAFTKPDGRIQDVLVLHRHPGESPRQGFDASRGAVLGDLGRRSDNALRKFLKKYYPTYSKSPSHFLGNIFRGELSGGLPEILFAQLAFCPTILVESEWEPCSFSVRCSYWFGGIDRPLTTTFVESFEFATPSESVAGGFERTHKTPLELIEDYSRTLQLIVGVMLDIHFAAQCGLLPLAPTWLKAINEETKGGASGSVIYKSHREHALLALSQSLPFAYKSDPDALLTSLLEIAASLDFDPALQSAIVRAMLLVYSERAGLKLGNLQELERFLDDRGSIRDGKSVKLIKNILDRKSIA